LQTRVEQIGLVQVVLEISGTGENQTSHVDLVVGDEVLDSDFRDLADVVVTLFLTKTGETQGRLTTTAVLLGKIDGELLTDITGVAGQSSEEGTVSVHDDETEGLIGLKQLTESLGVEFVVAEVERGVDGLERLEINVDLPLLAFGGDDFTTVDDKTVWRDLVVQLETLLCRSDGRQDGQTVDARLDVGGGTEFFGQHTRDTRDLILGRDDERDHGGAVSARLFEALDQLLHLPHLDVLLGLVGLWVTHDGGCVCVRAAEDSILDAEA